MQHVATFAHKSIPKSPYSMLGSSSESSEACQEDTSKKSKSNQCKTCKPSVLFRKRNTATRQLFTASPQSFQAPRSSGGVIFSFWIVQW